MCGRHRAAWAALALCLWSSVVWVGAGEGRRSRLVTKEVEKDEGEVLPRPGASTREREIAAIFRVVAYGAPTTTTSATSTTTSTTTTTTTTTSPYNTQQIGRSAESPPVRSEPNKPALRRDEDRSGVEHSSIAPPVSVGNVVNSTVVSLGVAWSARVYLTSALYSVVGVAALCLITKTASASPLLSTPYHLTLHLLLLVSAVCRCLHLLHEAPHFNATIPPAVLTSAEEGAWPLLTAGLAVVVVCALRSWITPSRPRLALILGGTAAAHLASLAVTHLGVILLKAPYAPLSLAASCVAITCGGVVGVAGLWAVWPLGKCHGSMDNDVRGLCAGQTPPMYLLLAASFVQLLLVSLRVYLLAMTPSMNPAWAWWCSLTLPHVLELILSGLLLAVAALTCNPPIGFIWCHCCQKRTAEIVNPSTVKMVHPMGVYTVEEVTSVPPKNHHARSMTTLSLNNTNKLKYRDNKSLDYVTSDFQLVWSHNRPLAATHNGHGCDDADEFLTLPPDKQSDLPRAHLFPIATAGEMNTELFTCTLPTYRLYTTTGAPSYYCERGNTVGRVGNGTGQPIRHSATLSRGSSGRVYSSPQTSLRTSRSWDELSTSHIYEEPQRGTNSGSVEEAMSDMSDLMTDCPSDPASPEPPSTRRRQPLPPPFQNSTLTVPNTHKNKHRDPHPLPNTSITSSASSTSTIQPPKTQHSQI